MKDSGADLSPSRSGNPGIRTASRHGLPSLKNVLIGLALTFLCLDPDVAVAGAECMPSYYRATSPACIDDVLAQLRQAPPSSHEPSTIIGFLAQLFRTSQQERQRILQSETSDYMKSVELVSLYRAGLPDDAQKFANANNLSELSEKLRAINLVALDAVSPSSIPSDNDLLIGAYMASGDTALIQRILDNYSSADDGMVSDGLRIGFMMSKFGPDLAPRGRNNVTMQAACAKYQCKVDQTRLLRVMTLATAFWSLQSLARQDGGIYKTVSDSFARDTRLKTALMSEQTAFGNYAAALAGVAAFKDDHTGDQPGQAYAAMSRSASIYESLGPANEALAPIASLKK